jgi:hypothetical protein
VIEFTITEAMILCAILASSTPPVGNEMVAFMLYGRIKRKLDEIS